MDGASANSHFKVPGGCRGRGLAEVSRKPEYTVFSIPEASVPHLEEL